MKKHIREGYTVLEIIIVLTILGIISTIILTTFTTYKYNQSLSKDTETIVEVLRQARSQTLSSQNATNYGVHFATSKITIFTGGTYTSGALGNQDFNLNSVDTILTVSLSGGGNDVIFDRLTGESTENGTVTVSSSGIPQTRVVTVYKTGLVESQ